MNHAQLPFDEDDHVSEDAKRKASALIQRAQIPIGDYGRRISCHELRELVEIRIREAQALASVGLPCGAYYLAGYAVELALKVRIAESVGRCEFPNASLAHAAYRHDLKKLLHVAGLFEEYMQAERTIEGFSERWETVLRWSETSRYNESVSLSDAICLIEAISNPSSGAISWIRQYWRVGA